MAEELTPLDQILQALARIAKDIPSVLESGRGFFDDEEDADDSAAVQQSKDTSNDLDHSGSSAMNSHAIISMNISSAFVTKLKDVARLNEEGKEALDAYAAAPTLAERLGMQYVLSLSISAKLGAFIETKEANCCFDDVYAQKIITKYAKAYVLSSTVKFYITCNPDHLLVQVLRSGGVMELPKEDDITGNTTLQSAVGRALVNACNQVKELVISSTSKATKQR
ncbi:hypothetical protein D9757_006693 [Collybiopsis confluens]|uniref:Uncharacterized protein n=1 Tax=Collybiopsis confluens TaxID=2823264 RepID=A0A8H5MA43_9AGAR|nr:hypothetical protein D9757_006693 [Collybiopsis confluens]